MGLLRLKFHGPPQDFNVEGAPLGNEEQNTVLATENTEFHSHNNILEGGGGGGGRGRG